MSGAKSQPSFESVLDELERWPDHASAQFVKALNELEQLAETGEPYACQTLAEILSLSAVHRDPERSYHWYYIALSQQGFSVAFKDHNDDPPHYCGPIGDFRNESMVSELVLALGFQRCRQLDSVAAAWLQQRGLS